MDSATQIGLSRKLKTPWKEPYLITKVINSVRFQIEDRKRSWKVHHDLLRLCNGIELPIWLQRKRSLTEETGESKVAEPEEEDVLNVESLFRDTEGQAADVPMYRNTATREASDVPMSRRNEAAISNDHENRSENSIRKRVSKRPAYLLDYTE